MEKMIPNGAPSLVGCKKLVVEGEITFAKDVVWEAQEFFPFFCSKTCHPKVPETHKGRDLPSGKLSQNYGKSPFLHSEWENSL